MNALIDTLAVTDKEILSEIERRTYDKAKIVPLTSDIPTMNYNSYKD